MEMEDEKGTGDEAEVFDEFEETETCPSSSSTVKVEGDELIGAGSEGGGEDSQDSIEGATLSFFLRKNS